MSQHRTARKSSFFNSLATRKEKLQQETEALTEINRHFTLAPDTRSVLITQRGNIIKTSEEAFINKNRRNNLTDRELQTSKPHHRSSSQEIIDKSATKLINKINATNCLSNIFKIKVDPDFQIRMNRAKEINNKDLAKTIVNNNDKISMLVNLRRKIGIKYPSVKRRSPLIADTLERDDRRIKSIFKKVTVSRKERTKSVFKNTLKGIYLTDRKKTRTNDKQQSRRMETEIEEYQNTIVAL